MELWERWQDFLDYHEWARVALLILGLGALLFLVSLAVGFVFGYFVLGRL